MHPHAQEDSGLRGPESSLYANEALGLGRATFTVNEPNAVIVFCKHCGLGGAETLVEKESGSENEQECKRSDHERDGDSSGVAHALALDAGGEGPRTRGQVTAACAPPRPTLAGRRVGTHSPVLEAAPVDARSAATAGQCEAIRARRALATSARRADRMRPWADTAAVARERDTRAVLDVAIEAKASTVERRLRFEANAAIQAL